MKRINLLLLTLVVLSAAVFVNAQSVPAGPDFWVTDSSGTYDTLSLPAGFFGSGSKAYSGRVFFTGDPASADRYDTKITRTQAVDLSRGSGTTGLVVEELRMKSVSPITVSYDDGHTEQWDVYATISSTQPSTGSMTISGGATGGNFNSTLNIIPKLNFVKSVGLGEMSEKGRTVKVLDLGLPFIQEYLKKEAQLAGERISQGKATPADEAAVATCKAEPVPTQNAAAPAATCGIKLSGQGTWRLNEGRFLPGPLTEAGLIWAHFVRPWFSSF